ncbi:hypothetical protein AWC22_14935 [Mycobacterium riyadhense]|uniref:Uncharacterized protein n=1 Tax=Mycobacterium riyadhense TaxID=486698 RepID=A0A1X2D6P7_9MYCO|nr:hypothetical protein AWC22_14935 [Mycobacterium riyadhense]
MEGAVVGYAYAHQFNSRAAYRWSAETSVYMAQDRQRCGDHDVAWWQLDLVGSDDEVDPPPEIATSAGDACSLANRNLR